MKCEGAQRTAKTNAWIALVAAVLVVASLAGLTQPAAPPLTGPVNDFANIIDDRTGQELDRRIRALQQASGDVVVVATVPSMKGFTGIEELALRMFENGGRGIGQKGKDNGALLVVAVEERQLRIEVGYDLEEFITDGFAGETIRDVIRPAFRDGDYSRGILAGTTRLIYRIAQRRGVELENVPREQPPAASPGGFNAWPLIVIVWIVIILLTNRKSRRRRGRWGRGPWSGWNSGVGPFGGGIGGFGGGFGGFGGGSGGFGGGGGFGGFGGGRSGGGGASGSW